MKKVSRPASRSRPLAIEASGTPVTPSGSSVSRAALSWPCPPSISTRSGQGEASPLRSSGSTAAEPAASGSASVAGIGRRARMLVQQPLEAPLQHLPHHAEIVAGRELGRADVELAILVLHEALRARDDHRADRVRALDVAVVIDLDPARRRRQPEGLGQRFQQRILRRGIGELARQRLARIGERMRHHVALLAALRLLDFDIVPALGRQRFGQQRALRQIFGDQNRARAGLVVVELRDEGIEHVVGRQARDRPSGNRRGCPSSGRCGRRTPARNYSRRPDGSRTHRHRRRRAD